MHSQPERLTVRIGVPVCGNYGDGVNLKKSCFILAFATSGLCVAFLLSWMLLAQANFLYGFWHDTVGIREGIEEYGPQNRFREGFAETSRRERIRLFAAINRAIHNKGEGLAEIYYRSPSVDDAQPLLRKPEIGHLQDVANLIAKLKWASLAMVIVWLACIGWAALARRPLPGLKHQLWGIGGVVISLGVLVLLIGPVTVFNQLHIWIFPADHPWFFYYQDSLMSTMMMAPRLFGWITLVWIPLALLVFVVLHLIAGLAVGSLRRLGR